MRKQVRILMAARTGRRYREATRAFAKGPYDLTPVVPSADAVVEMTRTRRPDVLIWDVSLPTTVSGKDLAVRLRKHAPNLPVVVLADVKTLKAKPDLIRAADEVVVVPFAPEELWLRVERAVRHAALARPSPIPLVTDLHDPQTGRIDAKRVAEYLGIPLAALAAAIGRDYKGVFKTPASESLQSILANVYRTALALHRRLARREESLAWLNAPNPELGDKRPKDLILGGKAEMVADLLEGALAGASRKNS
jgi:DNA-binding NarL/FixJ family response regulator